MGLPVLEWLVSTGEGLTSRKELIDMKSTWTLLQAAATSRSHLSRWTARALAYTDPGSFHDRKLDIGLFLCQAGLGPSRLNITCGPFLSQFFIPTSSSPTSLPTTIFPSSLVLLVLAIRPPTAITNDNKLSRPLPTNLVRNEYRLPTG